jgi:hypothetical protein
MDVFVWSLCLFSVWVSDCEWAFTCRYMYLACCKMGWKSIRVYSYVWMCACGECDKIVCFESFGTAYKPLCILLATAVNSAYHVLSAHAHTSPRMTMQYCIMRKIVIKCSLLHKLSSHAVHTRSMCLSLYSMLLVCKLLYISKINFVEAVHRYYESYRRVFNDN